MKKILFVCTGNSCRSVMAQGLLRHAMKKKERSDVQVLSAGVGTSGGIGPTLETVEVMSSLGIDVSTHIGQPVTRELVRHADAIFCMEEFHREWILSKFPEAEKKTYLLKSFQASQPLQDVNIPDPIGQPKEVYESCLMTIQDGVEKIIRWLGKEGP